MKSILLISLWFLAACRFDPSLEPPDHGSDPCGGTCGVDEVCEPNGSCRLTCPEGTTECEGACVNTDITSAHCGACGNACPTGQACDGTGECTTCSEQRLLPTACTTSAPGEVTDCEELYDALEFASPPTKSRLSGLSCDEAGGSSFCAYDAECPDGCIRDAWVQFDLGAPRFISRVRFLADWWMKRPENWTIWVSDEPTMTPGQGATLVAEGVGEQPPWYCADGELCTDSSIPDACCPDGRDHPQDTTDVGPYWPRFDELTFDGRAGRYWYYVINDCRDDSHCLVFEVELFGDNCAP